MQGISEGRIRQGIRAHAGIMLTGLLLAFATQVHGEERRATTEAISPAERQPTACQQAIHPVQKAAVAEAGKVLEALWLATKDGYFVAYTMPGMQRNPFDPKPLPPDSGPRDGVVQVRMPACSIETENEARYIVRFTTPFYRFHEAAAGWSPPLRDGLLMAVEVVGTEAGLQARDLWVEYGILERNEKARRPEKDQLPRVTRWAEPVPGCGRSERWNGSDCVKRRQR